MVVLELAGAELAVAESFDWVGVDGWSRDGRRFDGEAFSVESFAR